VAVAEGPRLGARLSELLRDYQAIKIMTKPAICYTTCMKIGSSCSF